MKKNDNILLLMAAVILPFTLIVMLLQNKKLEEYKQIINSQKTEVIIETDTIIKEKEIVDSIPTIKYVDILKTDTVYEKDSLGNITREPKLIFLKKKITKE